MEPLPFFSRIWLAWVWYFKVLFDGEFAAKVMAVSTGALPAAPAKEEPKLEAPKPEPKKVVEEPKVDPVDGALQLLSLLQREGRFVDFIEEDVASFTDADIGAAARVVHTGCRKALRDHMKLAPVRSEEEGAKVSLETTPADVKLTGNVSGKGPHSGVLRHRGWRASDVKMPTAIAGHDARVVAQAEVEL